MNSATTEKTEKTGTSETEREETKLENVIGLAIGKHTHTVLMWQGEYGEYAEDMIPNSSEGCERLLQIGASKTLVISGSRRWALPISHTLAARGILQQNIRYIASPRRETKKTKKGERESTKKFLRLSLEQGARGRPMFEEKRPRGTGTKEEVHAWYQLAQEYRKRVNECRRLKHRILSELSVLFPECVRPSLLELKKKKPIVMPLPSDIWTKKMAPVLECPDPAVLAKRTDVPASVRELAGKSLARFLPATVRAHHMALHAENLKSHREAVAQRDAALERLRAVAGEHPIAKHFENSDSAVVLASLIGWRKWPWWRELRSFAGFAVTRVDSKGKPRISRVRGEIRQYLYILRRTKLGKELAALSPEIIQRLKDEKKRSRLVKELEKLLKNLWKMYLR